MKASAARAPAETSIYLLDTGPLLALVNRRDQHHAWVRRVLGQHSGRLLTCEAVISEAWFLAQSRLSQPSGFLALLERLPLEVAPAWGSRALQLMQQYEDRPMAVADACLVVLAEQERSRIVVTVDREDFSVYRIHGRQVVPTLMPPE